MAVDHSAPGVIIHFNILDILSNYLETKTIQETNDLPAPPPKSAFASKKK